MFSCETIPLFFFHVCKWVCVFVSSCKRHQRGQENPLYVFLRTDPFLCRPACVFCFLFFVFCFLFCVFVCIIKAGGIGSHRDPFFLSSLPLPVCSGRKQASKKKKDNPYSASWSKDTSCVYFTFMLLYRATLGRGKKKK